MDNLRLVLAKYYDAFFFSGLANDLFNAHRAPQPFAGPVTADAVEAHWNKLVRRWRWRHLIGNPDMDEGLTVKHFHGLSTRFHDKLFLLTAVEEAKRQRDAGNDPHLERQALNKVAILKNKYRAASWYPAYCALTVASKAAARAVRAAHRNEQNVQRLFKRALRRLQEIVPLPLPHPDLD